MPGASFILSVGILLYAAGFHGMARDPEFISEQWRRVDGAYMERENGEMPPLVYFRPLRRCSGAKSPGIQPVAVGESSICALASALYMVNQEGLRYGSEMETGKGSASKLFVSESGSG